MAGRSPDPSEMLVNILQQMQQANQQTQQMLREMPQQSAVGTEALRGQMELTREAQMKQSVLLNEALQSRRGGVVDVRQIGKPETLKGSREAVKREWKQWSFVFKAWFCSQFTCASEVLAWAKDSERAVTAAEIQSAGQENAGWKNQIESINSHLHVALISLLRDEPLTVVRNSAEGMGLDAWRRLCKEFDPETAPSNLQLLKKILQPKRHSSPENLLTVIENWEQLIKLYESRSKDVVKDDYLRLGLMELVPTNLQEHLHMQMARIKTYREMRDEVDAYIASKDSVGPDPMDCDAISKGKSKGKGKTKTKAKTESWKAPKAQGLCGHCQKPLSTAHTEFYCWYNPRNPDPVAVAKRKAHTGKGKQSNASSYLGSRNSGKPSAQSAGKPSAGKGKSSKHAKTCNSLEEGTAEDQWPGEAPAEQGNLVQSVFTLAGQEDDVVTMDDATAARVAELQAERAQLLKMRRAVEMQARILEVQARRRQRLREERGRDHDHHAPDHAHDHDHKHDHDHEHDCCPEPDGKDEHEETAEQFEKDLHKKADEQDKNAEQRKKNLLDKSAPASATCRLSDRKTLKPTIGSMHAVFSALRHVSDINAKVAEAEAEAETDPTKKAELLREAEREKANRAKATEFRDQKRQQLQQQQEGADVGSKSTEEYMKTRGDARYRLDVSSGVPTWKAWKRFKARTRAGLHTRANVEHLTQRRSNFMEKEREHVKKFDPSAVEFIDITGVSYGAKFDGDGDVQPDWERAPLSWKELVALKRLADPEDRGDQVVKDFARKQKTKKALATAPWRTQEKKDCSEEAPWKRPRPSGSSTDLLSLTTRAPQPPGKGDATWERVDFTVDSGSAVSAIPPGFAREWPMGPNSDGPSSYMSASEHSVQVLGCKSPVVQFQGGLTAPVDLKVLKPLKKPIFSVERMNKTFKVVLNGHDSYAEHRATGQHIRIYKRNGVFVMPVWIQRDPTFQRQAS